MIQTPGLGGKPGNCPMWQVEESPPDAEASGGLTEPGRTGLQG